MLPKMAGMSLERKSTLNKPSQKNGSLPPTGNQLSLI